MATDTAIEWCDHTWNPWLGCKWVHRGCDNCYAQAYFKQYGIVGKRRRTADDYWRNPLKWNRDATSCTFCRPLPGWTPTKRLTPCPMCHGIMGGKRPRVFLSLCDVFEDWQGPIVNAKGTQLYYFDVPDGTQVIRPIDWITQMPRRAPVTMADVRRDMFDLIDECQNLDWLLLTKRSENIRPMWTPVFNAVVTDENLYKHVRYRENCWLLYSASDQETLEAGIGHLLKCRDLVPVLGLSLEPLLGPVQIPFLWTMVIDERDPGGGGPGYGLPGGKRPNAIDWVIVGGESGPGARPCNLADVRDVRDQCKSAGVPCYIKQLGSNPIGIHEGQYVDYLLKHPKGGDPDEWPEDVRVREFPVPK